MATLLDELNQIISALEDSGIEYAVCGGLALTVYGFVRASYGLDFLIRPESLEKVCEIAKRYGYNTPELNKLFEKSSVKIRRISKIDDVGEVLPLKFLLVNPKIEDVWETRENLIWEDKTLWIVSRTGLIRMKELAGRNKDLIDIGRLKDDKN